MSIVAAPEYLGSDFKSAAPGHRFNMYLSAWEEGSWVRTRNTAPVIKETLLLNDQDQRLLEGVLTRQKAIAAALEAQGQLLCLDARSQSPFATGLGNEHPLENGFAFLTPYGLPYLAGSGVKGVLRAAARELASGEFPNPKSWTIQDIDILFGRGDTDDEKSRGVIRRGALIFWDVFPGMDKLSLEIMNPHQAHYYQKKESPHDTGKPIPIYFLTVPPGTAFAFHIQCQLSFLTEDLRKGGRWKGLVTAALEHAFDWLGFGAKTAVGYGAMAVDHQAQADRERIRKEAEEKRRQEEEAIQRQKALEAMTPLEQKIHAIMAASSKPAHRALIDALDRGDFQGEEQARAAEFARDLMRKQGIWKENSEKRNKDKDRNYQDTKKVQSFLNGKGP